MENSAYSSSSDDTPKAKRCKLFHYDQDILGDAIELDSYLNDAIRLVSYCLQEGQIRVYIYFVISCFNV